MIDERGNHSSEKVKNWEPLNPKASGKRADEVEMDLRAEQL